MRDYSLDCVPKLRRDELDSALEVLHMMFDQSEPLPTSTEGTVGEGNWPSISRCTNMGFFPFPDTRHWIHRDIPRPQNIHSTADVFLPTLRMCTILVIT